MSVRYLEKGPFGPSARRVWRFLDGSLVCPLLVKKRQLCLIKLVSVPPGLCAVVVCVNLGSIWAGLCFDRGCGDSEVGVSPVTRDL